MTIVLFGRATSSNVQKVVWALEELGLAYERRDVGGAYGGTDTPEYLAMNPNKLVPTLVDGDVTIWESNAIVRYLAQRHDPRGILLPADWPSRARADQWMDWFSTTLGPALGAVFQTVVRSPRQGRDLAKLARDTDTLNAKVAMLDKALADRPFLARDTLSMGDIPCGMAMYRFTTMPFDRVMPPNVARWHARLRERPAYVKGVEVSWEPLRHPEA